MLKSRRQKQMKPTRIFLVCDEPSCLLKIWSLSDHQLLTVHSRFSCNFKNIEQLDTNQSPQKKHQRKIYLLLKK
ncbi:hypothetical protein Q3G72_019983 [Acer saccharum]|nr:hypothetical protein Q3G72_019983 [Acer saccharum]